MTKTKTLTLEEAREIVEELKELERERSRLSAGYSMGYPEAVDAMSELDEKAAKLRATGAESQVLNAEADAIEQAKPGWLAAASTGDSSAALNLTRADERIRALRKEAARLATPAKAEAYKQEGLDKAAKDGQERRQRDRQRSLSSRIINTRRAEMFRRGAGGPNVAGQLSGTAEVVRIAQAVENTLAVEFDKQVEEVFGEGFKAAHIRDEQAEASEFGIKLGPEGKIVSAAGEVEPTVISWRVTPETGEVLPAPEQVQKQEVS